MRPLNRPWEQAGNFPGPEAFKTYQLSAPIQTHRRRASCAEVECPKRERGFKAVCDTSTVAGQKNARWIEKSGKAFTRSAAGPVVTYTFPVGQDCFDRHTVSLEREPAYIVRGGDHRGNPRAIATFRHRNGDDWVADFAEHQDRIIALHQRG